MNSTVKFATLLLVIPMILSGPKNLPRKEVESIVEVEPIQIQEISVNSNIDTTMRLVNALIQVESRGLDSAIGDTHLGEPSIGVLQIRPIMVREVNRILKKQKSEKRFKLKDRFNREKSIEMFMVWKNYYHPKGGFEEIARTWNGGPRGHKIKRTEHYWAKVQLELNKKDI